MSAAKARTLAAFVSGACCAGALLVLGALNGCAQTPTDESGQGGSTTSGAGGTTTGLAGASGHLGGPAGASGGSGPAGSPGNESDASESSARPLSPSGSRYASVAATVPSAAISCGMEAPMWRAIFTKVPKGTS